MVFTDSVVNKKYENNYNVRVGTEVDLLQVAHFSVPIVI